MTMAVLEPVPATVDIPFFGGCVLLLLFPMLLLLPHYKDDFFLVLFLYDDLSFY